MNHTPAPWVIGGQHAPHHPLAILHETSVRATCVAAICDQGVSGHRLGEVEANARLIAAAPDLLAVVQEMLPILEALDPSREDGDEEMPIITRTRAAIARATGSKP